MGRTLRRTGFALGLGLAAAVWGASTADAATTASLSGTGRLTVNGSTAGETIVVRAVNSSTIGVGSRTFPASSVRSIQVNGLGGNDTIRIDDVRLAFTSTRPTVLDGGNGNDTLRGGRGGETLRGGAGNDTVTGRTGNDTVDLGAGADTSVWNVGHGNDQVQGGTGADTQQAFGTAAADAVTLTKQGAQARIAAAGGSTRTAAVEELAVQTANGNDSLTVGLLTGLGLTGVEIDMGLGTDPVTVNGSSSFDEFQVVDIAPGFRFIGGIADNSPANLVGSESLAIATGDTSDQVTIAPGGAPVTLDAGAGDDDELVLFGTEGLDDWDLFTAGATLKVTSTAVPQIDATNVEQVVARPGAGPDDLRILDLTGAGVTEVDALLESTSVPGSPDGSADVVTVVGSGGPDVASATQAGGIVSVGGLPTSVDVEATAPAQDRLVLEGGTGNDNLSGTVGLASEIDLTLDGGDDNDTLGGGNGADTLLGGAGVDNIDGGSGNDTAFAGGGNDTFVWDPGDGSDVVEGQEGVDTLLFNGSAAAELLAASSNGGRLLFTRNVGNIIMDTDDVEALTVNALAGTDTATVNNLSSTDVREVVLNLGVNAAGDAAVDAVAVVGTAADNVFQVTGAGGVLSIRQPDVDISVVNGEPANDAVTINGSGGNDGFFSSASGTNVAAFTYNGGANDDVLVGTGGNDLLNGDSGDDVILAGAGADTIACGTGTDDADGGSGTDSQTFCETITNIP